MKYLLIMITLVTLMNAEESSYHDNFCKENPFASRCVPEALGGTDNIKKERRREKHNDYYELDDHRNYPGQDMEDPRTTL